MDCLIAGASGLVGNELLHQLVADARVGSVTAVARGSLPLENPKLKILKADFSRLDGSAFPRADAAFCCLGTTIAKAGSEEAFFKVDHDAILNFASACRAAGVTTFALVSALGADANSRVFYNRVKGRTEDDLRKLGFARLVIIRPSLLLGERAEKRPAEKAAQVLSRFLVPVMVGPLAHWRPVAASQVAAKLKSAAFDEPSSPAVRVIANDEI